jgi:oxygen-independent coproporphyrinogen-3 oxidase
MGTGRSAPPSPTTTLYVHVPFCVVKCGYCDFTSYTVDGSEPLDTFLSGLERELTLTTLPRAPASVFIGGGTPSYLDEDRLARFFGLLNGAVDLSACAEVTMEMNPESVTPRKAELALAAGVTRASMGAQSFDPRHLRFLDRAHDADRTRRAFADLRAAGFTNISLDLIACLPGQTLAQWEADLQQALVLDPDHLSCYSLTFEPGTRLARDLAQGSVRANDEELDRAMFLHTRARLGEAGFVAYEISNFAGRGGPCRHNDHYWLQGDYAGVGPGAASHRAGVRWTNLKALDAWAASVAAGLPPVAMAETLTPGQRAAEAMWLGLRRRDGVDVRSMRARTGIGVESFGAALRPFVARGWLECDALRLCLTEEGILYADEVGAAILRHNPSPA